MIQLKLMSGEEIIAQSADRDDKGITLIDPLVIHRIQGSHEAQVFYTMKSWYLQQYTSDNAKEVRVRVSRHAIASTFAPTQVTVDQYDQTVEYLKSQKDMQDYDADEEFDSLDDWNIPYSGSGRLN